MGARPANSSRHDVASPSERGGDALCVSEAVGRIEPVLGLDEALEVFGVVGASPAAETEVGVVLQRLSRGVRREGEACVSDPAEVCLLDGFARARSEAEQLE